MDAQDRERLLEMLHDVSRHLGSEGVRDFLGTLGVTGASAESVVIAVGRGEEPSQADLRSVRSVPHVVYLWDVDPN